MSDHNEYGEASYPEVESLTVSARGQLLLKDARFYSEGKGVDVLIENDVIAEIGENLTAEDEVEILKPNLLAPLPGLVDIHVHLREPGHEDTETLITSFTVTARGDFATVFTVASTAPVADDPPITESVWFKGQALNSCDVHPVDSVTKGLEGETLTEFGMTTDSQAEVRIFSDDGRCVDNPLIMRHAVEYARGEGVLLAQHRKDPRLTADASAHEGPTATRLGLTGWPRVTEESITACDAIMTRDYGGCMYICHASVKDTAELIRRAKGHGIPLAVEVTPYRLILTDEKLETYDNVYRVNPPLREQHDTLTLHQTLVDGVTDCIATGHVLHGSEKKCYEFEYAKSGALGLETSVPIITEEFVLKGDCDWRWLAKITSKRSAQTVKLPGHDHPIAVGEPADLTIVGSGRKWTVRGEDLASKSENTPYEEMEMAVSMATTVLRGGVTTPNGKITG